ncbi:hypothetical protein LAG90_05555 [Marinilongibacter aquaticus]|uniref:hypothetical protein n=1 Tax=Marinilongibacter aquaticus TaxID=2975157 RepID=UPI0021BD1BD8|nr:hypothetical protein [Marinilongibacter aquaticus]UBM60106.1 hypothetical protein LAG90_05555 [Marinilongibacter aquaticus]
MKLEENLPKLRKACFGVQEFPEEVLDWIAEENLWNIWVPKSHGGLEMSLAEGLDTLKTLAKADGSLGWTVTLCAGANYFIGNLEPAVAKEIFQNNAEKVCFGGSGGLFGTAEKQGEHYLVSGVWKYGTGAPYLTHFTLNAKIVEKGKELLDTDGQPLFRSFVLPKNRVQIIEDWNTMGLKATATHSFEVQAVRVHDHYSFMYNAFHLPQAIYKIPFSTFADLTLWVNYLGMALHFLEEAQVILDAKKLDKLQVLLSGVEQKIFNCAADIQEKIDQQIDFTEEHIQEIHRMAADSVQDISHALIDIFPTLGVRASRENQPLNQIFKDYFTGTQHYIFAGR